jgi:hypothetical protein
MPYHWRSVLFFLTAVLLTDFATPLEPWDDMQVKHTWNAVPVNWEGLGHPPSGTRITLHIALRPEWEGALIDAVSEVSEPRHPRHVITTLRSRIIHVCRFSVSDTAHTVPFCGSSC